MAGVPIFGMDEDRLALNLSLEVVLRERRPLIRTIVLVADQHDRPVEPFASKRLGRLRPRQSGADDYEWLANRAHGRGAPPVSADRPGPTADRAPAVASAGRSRRMRTLHVPGPGPLGETGVPRRPRAGPRSGDAGLIGPASCQGNVGATSSRGMGPCRSTIVLVAAADEPLRRPPPHRTGAEAVVGNDAWREVRNRCRPHAMAFTGGPGRHCPGVRKYSRISFSERSRQADLTSSVPVGQPERRQVLL